MSSFDNDVWKLIQLREEENVCTSFLRMTTEIGQLTFLVIRKFCAFGLRLNLQLIHFLSLSLTAQVNGNSVMVNKFDYLW